MQADDTSSGPHLALLELKIILQGRSEIPKNLTMYPQLSLSKSEICHYTLQVRPLVPKQNVHWTAMHEA